MFGLPSTAAAAAARQVDEDKIQQLVDMGFPRAAAETALVRTSNHVGRAAEYLLTHPDVVAAATFAAATEAAAQPNAGAATQTTGEGSGGAAAQPAGTATGSGSGSGPAGEQIAEANEQAMDDDEDNGGEDNEDDEMADGDEEDENLALARALAMSLGQSVVPTDAAGGAGPSEPREQVPTATTPPSGPAPTMPTANEANTEVLAEKKLKLQQVRDHLKEGLFVRSLSLLDSCEPVVFDVQQILNINSDDFGKNIETLIKSIEETPKSSLPWANKNAIMRGRLRLLALIANEPSTRLTSNDAYLAFLSPLMELLSDKADGEDLWLAPALLLLETFASAAETVLEPKATDLAESATSKATTAFTSADKVHLTGNIVRAFRDNVAAKDIVHACLRLLVRLTRRTECAAEFVKQEGISLLFESVEHFVFGGQQALIVTILRHLFEDSATLELLMETEVTVWLRKRTSRPSDVTSFVKSTAQLVCRDAHAFVGATSRVAKLVGYDTGVRNPQITLAKSDPETATTVNEGGAGTESNEKQTNGDATELSFAADSRSAAADAPQVDQLVIVNALVARFLAKADGSDDAAEAMIRRHIHRSFILQALTELATSFVTCRDAIVSYGVQGKDAVGSFISNLLNEVLPVSKPVSESAAQEAATIMDLAESSLGTQLLVVLCTGSASEGYLEANVSPDKGASFQQQWNEKQKHIRGNVLDAVARAMKDATAGQSLAEDRYSKYAAYAELVTRVVAARPMQAAMRPNGHVEEPQPAQVAKDMLDKHFVSMLTAMVADVDVHHPQSRMVISILLKPIETLTKVATKVANTVETSSSASTEQSAPPVASLSAISVPPTSDHIDDIDEMVRTSALGVLNATDVDEGLEDMSDDSDEDEEDFDDDEGDSDEEGSDGDEDLSDAEDQDMELVHQPYRRDVSINDADEAGSEGSEDEEGQDEMSEGDDSEDGGESVDDGSDGDEDLDDDGEDGEDDDPDDDNMSWDDVDDDEAGALDAGDAGEGPIGEIIHEIGHALFAGGAGAGVGPGPGAEGLAVPDMEEDGERGDGEGGEDGDHPEGEDDDGSAGEGEQDEEDQESQADEESDDDAVIDARDGLALLNPPDFAMEVDGFDAPDPGMIMPRLFGAVGAGRGLSRRRQRFSRRQLLEMEGGDAGRCCESYAVTATKSQLMN